jgi:PAS domain S-box-containing protein
VKLFTRTLLFFACVIGLQALLAILAITSVTGRTNLADARRDLGRESTILFDSLHAWKRQFWISINGVVADRRFADLRAAGRPDRMDQHLRELMLSSKADAIVLRTARGGTRQIVASGDPLDADVIGAVTGRPPHTHLELASAGGSLCLLAVANFPDGDRGGDEIVLLKRLDAEFCGQLVLNRDSEVGLYLGGRWLAGSFAAPKDDLFDPAKVAGATYERYDVRIDRQRYNVSWQRLDDGLFLATFLSNEPYDARVATLDRAVLGVSAAAALLSIALGLLLTRAITRPVAELLAGMDRISRGAWEARVPVRGGLEIGRLFLAFNDMARDLGRSQASLQESLSETLVLKEYNESIVEAIRAGICIVDRDLAVEKVNRFFAESFGVDAAAAVGRPLAALGLDAIDYAVTDEVRAVLARRRPDWTGLKRSRDGRVYEIRVHPFSATAAGAAAAPGCILMIDDVSARTELEEKIFRAEKLATISVLSAGMAHEINNPLGAILSNAQNLLADEDDPDRRVALEWIEQEARRIARIIEELRHFASTDPGHAPGADVGRVVAEVARLVRHSLARDGRVRIDTRLERGLPPSAVSGDELTQVVVNLLRNSVQAIDGPGRILVTARRAPDDRLLIAVADTGAGIPPEVLPRIFDPFFTTRGGGEGQGLGLSVVYGIVKKYNGTIGVQSRLGRGTRIALSLPRREGETA